LVLLSIYVNPAAAITSPTHTPHAFASSELAISQTILPLGSPFESENINNLMAVSASIAAFLVYRVAGEITQSKWSGALCDQTLRDLRTCQSVNHAL
jgi:hypothetical protein